MPVYFFKRFFIEHGPLSKEELKNYWLFPNTLIKSSEDEHWKTLSETGELKDLLPIAKKRLNLAFFISSILIAAIVFFILFSINRTHPADIVEQDVPIENSDVPFKRKYSEKRDTASMKVPEKVSSEWDAPLMKIKKPELLTVTKFPAKKIHLSYLENYKREVRNHFQDHISTLRSSFINDPNGGVSDVNVVLLNSTIFVMDEIQVRAQYMDAKGSLIDELLMNFHNVKPNVEVNKIAPSNPKSKFVKFIITSAKSRSLNFCYPSANNNKGDKDPFYCR